MKKTRNCKTSPVNGSVVLAQYLLLIPNKGSAKGLGSLHMPQAYTGVATIGATLHGIIGKIKERIVMTTAMIVLLFNIPNILGVFILLV